MTKSVADVMDFCLMMFSSVFDQDMTLPGDSGREGLVGPQVDDANGLPDRSVLQGFAVAVSDRPPFFREMVTSSPRLTTRGSETDPEGTGRSFRRMRRVSLPNRSSAFRSDAAGIEVWATRTSRRSCAVRICPRRDPLTRNEGRHGNEGLAAEAQALLALRDKPGGEDP